MNIAQAIDAIEAGEFVRHTDRKGVTTFYFKITVLPFESQEICSIEDDDMEYDEKRPDSFKDIPWTRRESIILTSLMAKDYEIEPRERVLAMLQQAWDKGHKNKS